MALPKSGQNDYALISQSRRRCAFGMVFASILLQAERRRAEKACDKARQCADRCTAERCVDSRRDY